MSYSIGMSSIDNRAIKTEELKEFCENNPEFKLDDTGTWASYDQVILYRTGETWDYVCGIDNEGSYADCATPDDDLFEKAWKIADYFNLFIFGEANEIYYIPNYGQPKNHIDFEIAKSVYRELGYDIEVIIEKATLCHN